MFINSNCNLSMVKKAFADSLKTVEERKVVDAQLKQEKHSASPYMVDWLS
ncbi:MAG: hypothetical protein IPL10_20585 [Bacteroidetes bacterium]|nr:hypothetical protein [Bacteroidota bacterium]